MEIIIPGGKGKKNSDLDILSFSLRVLIVLGLVGTAIIIFLLFWYAFNVILIGFLGVLLAVFFRGLADWLAKLTRLPPGLSLAIVIILLIGAFVAGFFLLIPDVHDQISGLYDQIVASLNQLARSISKIPLGQYLMKQIPTSPSQMTESGALGKGLQKIFTTTFTTVTEIVILFFVGIYLAASPEFYVRGLIRLIPKPHRERARHIIGEVGNTLRWWLAGIFFDMALVGVFIGIGLWLLSIPLALILAIISGLLTFIPTVGLLLSLIPAFLVAITAGVAKTIAVLILYLVAHAIEAYVAGPLVQQRAVSVPPVLLIMALFVFGELFGVLGLIIAAPFTAVSLVLIKILYVEHILGDRIEQPPESQALHDTEPPQGSPSKS